ncbi:Tat pathway signal protein [Micromonospora sp. WMMD1082]|uniref:Tat pathway signal protein n=1 Tax=Micromonospora sp. WMMD1082 TaxID=3016104 RepID=UPI0024167276|nr:Tat pathway signal protein [Micromonospora sp. WMMD1082]MDG4794156.1 Tat pathway signal protein [Micromonospora sp. WMMD1082]
MLNVLNAGSRTEGQQMARAPRQRNEKLLTVIKECQWSYDACAVAVRAVAQENGETSASFDRSHVGHWIAGVTPSSRNSRFLAEAISRRLGRVVNPIDLGLRGTDSLEPDLIGLDWWEQAPATDLITVGRADLERREFGLAALYSLAALAVPLDSWQEIAERGRRAQGGVVPVGRSEIDAVRDMLTVFSRADERLGGGYARLAVVQYLTSDVAGYLQGRFSSAEDRKAMFSVAAETTYLAGWKAFDSSLHGLAQRYYVQALRLANEADDRPLAGFTLRAMAHQAVDLGHGQEALQLADAALAWSRGRATPAATALFTILTARGHAATGDKARTSAAIRAAETHLAKALPDDEPAWIRTSGFTETSLASQAGQALRDLGDLPAAETQLRRSIATRNPEAYRRIHTLTLANLADVQCGQGRLREATEHWNHAMDTMSGVTSGRASSAVKNIRTRLSSFGPRLPSFAKQLDQRATAFLRHDHPPTYT